MNKFLTLLGVFIPFSEALDLCLRFSLPVLFVILTFVATSLATSNSGMDNTEEVLTDWRLNSTESVIDFTRNDLLLGSQDTFFWFLIPLFGLISIGLCVVVNYVVMALIYALSTIRRVLISRRGYIKHDDPR